MPMKSPPHPGALIRDLLDELALPMTRAAAGLGVTRQQLYNVMNGRSALSPDMALRIEQALGGTADAWMRMQIAHDLARLRARKDRPVVARLAPRAA